MRKVGLFAAAAMAVGMLATTAEAIGSSNWNRVKMRVTAKAKLKGDKNLRTTWEGGGNGYCMVGAPGSFPISVAGDFTITDSMGFPNDPIPNPGSPPEGFFEFLAPVSKINGPQTKAACKGDLLTDNPGDIPQYNQVVDAFARNSSDLFLNDQLTPTDTLPLSTTYNDVTTTRDTFSKLKTSGSVKAFENFTKIKGKLKYAGKGTIQGKKFKITIIVVIVQGDRNL